MLAPLLWPPGSSAGQAGHILFIADVSCLFAFKFFSPTVSTHVPLPAQRAAITPGFATHSTLIYLWDCTSDSAGMFLVLWLYCQWTRAQGRRQTPKIELTIYSENYI